MDNQEITFFDTLPSPVIVKERKKMEGFVLNWFLTGETRVLFNNSHPGLGKTHLIAEIIEMFRYKYWICFVVPSHQITESIKDLEGFLFRKKIRFRHLYGKSQEITQIRPVDHEIRWVKTADKYCVRKEEEMYFPGCSHQSDYPFADYIRVTRKDGSKVKICKFHQSCGYLEQKKRLTDEEVVICTPEMLYLFGDHPNKKKLLVFDESFDNRMISCIMERDVPRVFSHQSLHFFTNLKIDYLLENRPHSRFEKENKKVYQVSQDEPIKIDDRDTYFLQLWIDSQEKMICIDDRGLLKIWGKRRSFLSDVNYDKMIFNCATSSKKLISNLINLPENQISYYRDELFLKNPVMRVAKEWGYRNWNKHKKDIIKILSWISRRVDKIAIITKKSYKIYIENHLGHLIFDFITFGASRGMNKWNKPFDLVILLGKYAFTPEIIEIYRFLGFSFIEDIQNSEMEQGLNRPRLHLHEETPVLLFGTLNFDFKFSPNFSGNTNIQSLAFLSHPLTNSQNRASLVDSAEEITGISDYTISVAARTIKWLKKYVFPK